jgi:hypothetical protein
LIVSLSILKPTIKLFLNAPIKAPRKRKSQFMLVITIALSLLKLWPLPDSNRGPDDYESGGGIGKSSLN